MNATTESITYTILAGNLGDVTRDEAESYADAVEAALVAAFPATDVTVNLEHDVEGAAPAQFGVDEAILGEVEAIAQRVFESGSWLA